VPSEQTTVGLEFGGTTTVVFFGGGFGLPLLMHADSTGNTHSAANKAFIPDPQREDTAVLSRWAQERAVVCGQQLSSAESYSVKSPAAEP
jgi:hypothetical protein